MKVYTVTEMFWSMQGEGMRAGEMSLFIRFTGCNMLCSMEAGPKSPGGFDCDTEFVSGRRLTLDELVIEARATLPMPPDWSHLGHRPWIVLTGGEPGLQVDKPLIDRLRLEGFNTAIETNGSIDLSGLGIDWVTVSPKVAEHAIRQLTANEVKYVRGHGQALPKPTCKAQFQLISPAFNGLTIDRKALDWCVGLIRDRPEWRLSIQMHKAWGIR